jgi:hypothetical protein
LCVVIETEVAAAARVGDAGDGESRGAEMPGLLMSMTAAADDRSAATGDVDLSDVISFCVHVPLLTDTVLRAVVRLR